MTKAKNTSKAIAKTATKINLSAIAKAKAKANANAVNKAKRVVEKATLNTQKTDLQNALSAYKSDVLSLNKRCAHLIESGKCGVVTTKSALISVIKKYYPYVLEGGKFATMKIVFRENGTKYLHFTECHNISDGAIVNAYVSHLNATSMAFKVKARKQIEVTEFMNVDKMPLNVVEFDALVADRENDMLFAYNPTPEARAKVAKEKAEKYSKEYSDMVELKQLEASVTTK